MDLKELARRVGEEMFEAHRGAFLRGRPIIASGNDGSPQDARPRKYVAGLGGRLHAAGYEAGEPVLEDGGDYTWVMLITVPAGITAVNAREMVEALVWECWSAAHLA